MNLSIIVPCYNEEKNIELFFRECLKSFKDIENVEYIFINDGSKDNTWKEITKLINNYKELKIVGIDFSRNFGKESGIYAGLNNSTGNYVAIIDADLQQHPKYVKKMLDYILKNPEFDSVVCYQNKRKEGKVVTFLKKVFYKLINKVSYVEFYENASDFRLISRKMVNSLLSCSEYYRFSKGLFSFVGYDTYFMPYEVQERKYGKSSWNISKLFKYAIQGIIDFSISPLEISNKLGLLTIFISLISLIIVLIKKWIFNIIIGPFSIIIFLILLFNGLQMIILGIIGQYVGRNYFETKNRPRYIIRNKLVSGEISDEKINK